MLSCALGLRIHSGWGAAVVVSLEDEVPQMLDRRRIEIIEPGVAGAAQPYHFAEKLRIDAAEKHLKSWTEISARLALHGLREIAAAIRNRRFLLSSAAILTSSGRPLPSLPQILASHALIHAAEGEFFRQSFRTACAELKIPVSGIRDRDLNEQARIVFGKAAPTIQSRIASLGRTLGPPWTADQKNAALAAAIVLARKREDS